MNFDVICILLSSYKHWNQVSKQEVMIKHLAGVILQHI